MKPKKVNILGIDHEIIYVDKPSDVDVYERAALWGQIDHWTRTIRIYDNGRRVEDVFQTILHEILHGIASSLKLELGDDDNLDILALALTDVFFRNNWLSAGTAKPASIGEFVEELKKNLEEDD